MAAGRRGRAAARSGTRRWPSAPRDSPSARARPDDATGIALTPLDKDRSDDAITYRARARQARPRRRHASRSPCAGPDADAAGRRRRVHEQGADFWPLAVTRELDDLILDLRTNELELGTWVLRTAGDAAAVLPTTRCCWRNRDDWLVNEIVHYLKRTLKRLDVTSRSLIALVEPGSCFAGSLLELALAADRSFQLTGVFEERRPGRRSRPRSPSAR